MAGCPIRARSNRVGRGRDPRNGGGHLMQSHRFAVKLRRQDTGEEHVEPVRAMDALSAKVFALHRAQGLLRQKYDRKYGSFEVVSVEQEDA